MPTFSCFTAWLYDDPSPEHSEGVLDLNEVIAPYAASQDEGVKVAFASRSSYNVTNLLTEEGPTRAGAWQEDGILRQDSSPALYVCRTGYRDEDGTLHMSHGVFAAIGETTGRRPSPVPEVVTVPLPELFELLAPAGMPLARATDDDGAHHRLFRIVAPGITETICAALSSYSEGIGNGLVFIRTHSSGPLPPLGLVM